MNSQVTYVCYEDSGQITAIVKGPRNAIEEPLGSFIDYQGDEDVGLSWYVFDGEILQKPEQPSPDYVFDYVSGEWQLDFDIAKQRKWDAIKGDRTAQEFGTFDWGGYTFQCDEVSQRRIQGAVQLSAIDDTLTLDWTLADNSVQTFTAADYIQIGQALAVHVSQCHERGRILRLEIEAATTLEDLEAIVW